MGATPAASANGETFVASRWTSGNRLFPTKLLVTPMRVSRVKPRMFGSNEQSIPMTKVASVHISTGVFWSEIRIESTGGAAPLHSPRHPKAAAPRDPHLLRVHHSPPQTQPSDPLRPPVA